jgi:hypothetical protein
VIARALGKYAFETVGARVRAAGEPLPDFANLSPEAQAAWERAVALSFTVAPRESADARRDARDAILSDADELERGVSDRRPAAGVTDA